MGALYVPQPHPVVASRRGEHLPVGAERADAADHVRRRYRPQADLVVAVAGGEGLPVGAEAEGVHLPAAARERLADLRRTGRVADVPQARRAVRAAGREHGPRGVEGHGPQGAGVAGEGRAERFPAARLGHVPQPDGAVHAAAGERPAAGVEGHGVHRSGVALQHPGDRLRVPRVGHAPQPDRAVVATGGEGPPVGGERHGAYGGGVAGQRRAERLRPARVAHVPQPDGAVVLGGGQGASVRAEGEQIDGAAAALHRRAERARMAGVADVPQPGRAVVRSGGEGVAVRAEDRGAHPTLVAGQGLAQALGALGVRHVPQPDGPVVAGGGQEPSVGAERGEVDGAGVAEQRGGERRVHDRDQPVPGALVVRPQAVRHQVELGGQRGIRVLGAVGLGDHLLEHRVVPPGHGVVALLPRDDRRHDGHHRQGDKGRHRGTADQDRAPAQPGRRGEELPRAPGQEGVTGRRRPVAGLFQAGAPVEQGRVALGVLPGPAVLLQALPQQVVVPVLVDPVAQPRPGVQECLVGDLHGLRVEGHQPGADQRFEGLLRLVGVRRLLGELPPRPPPAGGLGVLAQPDETEQEQPRGRTRRRVEAGPGALGGRRHRSLDPARRAVTGQRKAARLPPLPGGEQSVGEERQDARVVRAAGPVGAHFPDDQLREAGFEFEPDGLGRTGHRGAQLGGGQRPEHHVPVLQRVGQLGVPEALLVEVGADAEDDERGGGVTGITGAVGVAGRAGGVQELDEGTPVRLVGAEGEGFLELVHDEDRPAGGGGRAPGPRGDGFPYGLGKLGCIGLQGAELGYSPGELGEGVGARHELQHWADVRVLAAGVAPFAGGWYAVCVFYTLGVPYDLYAPCVLYPLSLSYVSQCAVAQGGHQAGVQKGGLPRSRGAHEHDEAARLLRRAELGDEGVRTPLPAEEPLGVLLPIRGEAAVGAHAGDGRGVGRVPLVAPRGRPGRT
ncbi:putative WD repeat-containing protein [Streptomyces aurantiacus JA 4570]|uniref:Putative WD repeat-containing protein n=1 Tax=Streptomyces aurantiacus JA 4570 TaxID=1286094 RepID=S4AHZ1_9ACTN|nr:putative WD repeat-containing protein [Streptomyces aurantiacus JA 4570]